MTILQFYNFIVKFFFLLEKSEIKKYIIFSLQRDFIPEPEHLFRYLETWY